MWRPKQGAHLTTTCKLCVTWKYAPTTAAATEQPVVANTDVLPLSSPEIKSQISAAGEKSLSKNPSVV